MIAAKASVERLNANAMTRMREGFAPRRSARSAAPSQGVKTRRERSGSEVTWRLLQA
jgi:hypothetical protein